MLSVERTIARPHAAYLLVPLAAVALSVHDSSAGRGHLNLTATKTLLIFHVVAMAVRRQRLAGRN